MGKLILVRHGESTGNRERIYATRPHELALTELGEQQAREAGARIARLFAPELVVASTYVRARETARLIAEVLSLPLRIEEDLHERDLGQFRGQPYNAMSTAPDFDARRPWQWRPPQGESLEDVQARVVPVIERLAQSHRERDVVVVSHGGVIISGRSGQVGGAGIGVTVTKVDVYVKRRAARNIQDCLIHFVGSCRLLGQNSDVECTIGKAA